MYVADLTILGDIEVPGTSVWVSPSALRSFNIQHPQQQHSPNAVSDRGSEACRFIRRLRMSPQPNENETTRPGYVETHEATPRCPSTHAYGATASPRAVGNLDSPRTTTPTARFTLSLVLLAIPNIPSLDNSPTLPTPSDPTFGSGIGENRLFREANRQLHSSHHKTLPSGMCLRRRYFSPRGEISRKDSALPRCCAPPPRPPSRKKNGASFIFLTRQLYALAASRGPLFQRLEHGLLGSGPVARNRHRLRRHVRLHRGHPCQRMVAVVPTEMMRSCLCIATLSSPGRPPKKNEHDLFSNR